jgi:hypothetical protein
MAQSVRRLRAAQAARVRSPVPARHKIGVDKLSLFCNRDNPTSRGTSQALQLHCTYNKIYKNAVAKAKVFSHLEAWVHVGRGILHAKDFVSASALSFSKE